MTARTIPVCACATPEPADLPIPLCASCGRLIPPPGAETFREVRARPEPIAITSPEQAERLYGPGFGQYVRERMAEPAVVVVKAPAVCACSCRACAHVGDHCGRTESGCAPGHVPADARADRGRALEVKRLVARLEELSRSHGTPVFVMAADAPEPVAMLRGLLRAACAACYTCTAEDADAVPEQALQAFLRGLPTQPWWGGVEPAWHGHLSETMREVVKATMAERARCAAEAERLAGDMSAPVPVEGCAALAWFAKRLRSEVSR